MRFDENSLWGAALKFFQHFYSQVVSLLLTALVLPLIHIRLQNVNTWVAVVSRLSPCSSVHLPAFTEAQTWSPPGCPPERRMASAAARKLRQKSKQRCDWGMLTGCRRPKCLHPLLPFQKSNLCLFGHLSCEVLRRWSWTVWHTASQLLCHLRQLVKYVALLKAFN